MAENISHSESKELTQARQFIIEGEFEDGLQLLKDFEERGSNSLHDIVSCHLIKCILFLAQGLYREVVEFADQIYEESLGLGKNILSVDALLFKANGLLNLNQFDIAKEAIKQGEDLLKTLAGESLKSKNRREAYIFYLKGTILDPFINPKGEQDLALKYYNQSLALAESIGDNGRACACLLQIAWNISISEGKLDLALEFTERALTLAKEANHKFYISRSLVLKALFHHQKGRIPQCIPLYEQSLAIAKKIRNKRLISSNLNNLSDVYRMKGELDLALDYSLQSLDHSFDTGNFRRTAMFYDSLIRILIEKGDLEQAKQHFNKLEQINKQQKDKLINLVFIYNKAIFLKESPRISNRGRAEDILKQILEDKDIFWELKERVLLTLCELLLLELQMTGDLEVLEEVESLITQLLDTAENSRSYWIWGETLLLQAKLSLISLNLKEARRFLTQGQKTAEKYGLEMSAIKISNEHDELLTKLKIWENLKESTTSLSERLKLARLSEQMENMIRKRVIDVPELSNEESVFLLIISEGGTPIFSKSFLKDKAFEDHLFGGFFTAINSFINEKFSEGLDRASFGEYTLLMNSVSPFLMCYVYKGQSYSAQHRIRYFIDKLQSDKDVWQAFEKFYQMNQEIQLKDIPSLEPLIKDVFINRTIIT